jgi:hypothetical protein
MTKRVDWDQNYNKCKNRAKKFELIKMFHKM